MRDDYDVSVQRDEEGRAHALTFSRPAEGSGSRVRLNCANVECGREFTARAQVGNRPAPKCCSATCRTAVRIARLVAQGVQQRLNLGGSGVATVPSSALPPVKERVDEASGADPDKSSVRDVAQPPPHSRPDVAQVQHYDPGMGQSATKDEGRRVSGCLRIMTVLGRDRLRWWRYDDLGLAAGVRLGSVRTRCSNLRNAKPPVDFEERVVDGFREIRLGVR